MIRLLERIYNLEQLLIGFLSILTAGLLGNTQQDFIMLISMIADQLHSIRLQALHQLISIVGLRANGEWMEMI